LIAGAAADVLRVLAPSLRQQDARVLADAADALSRAARGPRRPAGRRSERAVGLRAMARLIALMGRLSDEDTTPAALRTVLEVSLLADAFAAWREAEDRAADREHLAASARRAARTLRLSAEPVTVTPPIRPSPPRGRLRAGGRAGEGEGDLRRRFGGG
jgi:hypothetical protein